MATDVMPQHMAALGRANEVRVARAALARRVHAGTFTEGRLMLADLLEADDPLLTTARLSTVLEWPRRSGPQVAARTVRAAMLSLPHPAAVSAVLHRQVGELSDRERAAIVKALRA
jgi:hypothetical protein